MTTSTNRPISQDAIFKYWFHLWLKIATTFDYLKNNNVAIKVWIRLCRKAWQQKDVAVSKTQREVFTC